MDSPNVELMSALSSLFESGKYSDLTLVCGIKRYSVHRALICPRSEFFEGACRNPFQESETGVIDLSEDDPEAVEHMVHYFYHSDYLTKPLSRQSSQRSSQKPSALSMRRTFRKKLDLSQLEDPLLATATATASSFNTPPSPPEDRDQEHAQRFGSHNPSTKLPDTPVAEQCEEDPFDAAPEKPAGIAEKPHLLLHSRVYALAEKYGIPGLKSLARKKFAQQIETHLQSTEFPEACQEAYETTVDSDRGLRDVIIQTFRAHPDLPLRPDVELVVRDSPGLAFELYRMASGLPVSS